MWCTTPAEGSAHSAEDHPPVLMVAWPIGSDLLQRMSTELFKGVPHYSRVMGRASARASSRPLYRLVRPRERDAVSLYALSTAFIRVCQPVPCARNHSSTSGSTRSEIARLEDNGFRPLRTMPRTMCRGSASGWLRLTLIFRSFREPTRVQSVCDALEVNFALTFRRLSH